MSDHKDMVDEAVKPFIDRPEAPRMSEEEITVLAQRFVTNEIFLAYSPEAMQAFQALITLAGGGPLYAGAAWESYSKAATRSVNGYPMFLSAHFVHLLDLLPLVDKINELCEAMGMPPRIAVEDGVREEAVEVEKRYAEIKVAIEATRNG